MRLKTHSFEYFFSALVSFTASDFLKRNRKREKINLFLGLFAVDLVADGTELIAGKIYTRLHTPFISLREKRAEIRDGFSFRATRLH